MWFKPFYPEAKDTAGFLEEFTRYLFVFQPTIKEISASRIVAQVGTIEHEFTNQGIGSAAERAIAEWYVLATWNASAEVIRSLQYKVKVGEVQLIPPSEN